jgi:hypothetical protein
MNLASFKWKLPRTLHISYDIFLLINKFKLTIIIVSGTQGYNYNLSIISFIYSFIPDKAKPSARGAGKGQSFRAKMAGLPEGFERRLSEMIIPTL